MYKNRITRVANLVLLSSLAVSMLLSIALNIALKTIEKDQIGVFSIVQPIVSLALMGIAYINLLWILRRNRIAFIEPDTAIDDTFTVSLESLPLTVAAMIMVYCLLRALVVNSALYAIAGLSSEQFISRWLIVIITSITVSIAAYLSLSMIAGRLYPAVRPLLQRISLPKPTIIFNISSIIIPNAMVLLAIYVYDIKVSHAEIDIPLFVIIAVVFSGMFILIQVIRDSIANPSDASRASDAISDAFIQKFHITDREKEIISLILNGLSNKEISESMDCSEKTVKNHLYNIYKKTGVSSRAKLNKLLRS